MRTARTRIIRIGNRQGIRIPCRLLEQAGWIAGAPGRGLGQEVELRIEQGVIVLRRPPRAGWAAQFAQMAAQGDDALLDDVPQASAWDEREWEW